VQNLLCDVVVVDLTRALAGPHAAVMLGDLGARVIKVEAPEGGDDSRGWEPLFVEGESTYLPRSRFESSGHRAPQIRAACPWQRLSSIASCWQ
jgi:crotonobetainyl-CoA:carnitine CoA-transferase CaiB-like acyl-CoA transferase